MNLNLDSIWAIEPLQGANLKAALLASVARQIQAGAADDAQRAGLPVHVSGNVAVIRISGPITKREGFLTWFYGFVSSQSVGRAINSAISDDGIEKILLVIDSPGGSVDGTDALADIVFEAKKTKDIIVQIDGMCASAAYWIGSQATKIYAGRNDLIGSIGVGMMVYDWHEAFKNAGIKAIPIDTGEFKSAGEEGTEVTDRHVADFKRIVDEYFKEFKTAVLRGRSALDQSALDEIADGRVFRGDKAIDLGLIDGIQTLPDTLAGLVRARGDGRKTSSALAKARLNLI